MSSVLEKLAQAGLTGEQIQGAQARAEGVLKEANRDMAFRKELLEKMGFAPWETAKRTFGPALGKSMAAVAAGGLIGLGATAAQKGYEAVEKGMGKAQAYKDMMSARPELKDRDPKAVQRAFDSLYRFNPSYAKDPLVAGSFVDSVSSSERLDLGTVNSLVTARKSMSGTPFEATKYLPRMDLKAEERDLGSGE